eukprot:COSAG01_NODE_15836_length_1294_cov_2.063598_1_plen_122_part_00
MPQDVEGIEAPEVPDQLEVLYCGGVWEAPAHCPVLRRQAAVSAGQPRRRRRSCVLRALLLSRFFWGMGGRGAGCRSVQPATGVLRVGPRLPGVPTVDSQECSPSVASFWCACLTASNLPQN